MLLLKGISNELQNKQCKGVPKSTVKDLHGKSKVKKEIKKKEVRGKFWTVIVGIFESSNTLN